MAVRFYAFFSIPTRTCLSEQDICCMNHFVQATECLNTENICDDGCIAILTKTNIYTLKNNAIVLRGHGNKRDGLWNIKLPTTQENAMNMPRFTASINVIITKDKSTTNLVKYFHVTSFSPSISTYQ